MVRFDAFDLIARRGHLEGVVDPFALSRLAEELDERLGDSEPAAGVRWRIDGTADALGHPALDVALDGALPVTCQRCLGALAFRVTQRTRLLVAKSEAELAALDDSGENEVVLGASPLDAPAVAFSLFAFVVVYFTVFGAGIWYLLKLMKKPPEAHESALDGAPIRTAGVTPALAVLEGEEA